MFKWSENLFICQNLFGNRSYLEFYMQNFTNTLTQNQNLNSKPEFLVSGLTLNYGKSSVTLVCMLIRFN